MIPGNRPEDLAEEEFWEMLMEKLIEAGFDESDVGDMSSEESLTTKAIEIARDMGYTRGFNEGRDEERMAQSYKEEERSRLLDRQAQERDFLEAHFQGLHDEIPRDGCPECEDRRNRVGP